METLTLHIISLDDEITEIKSDLKRKEQECRKELDRQFKLMMEPHRQSAKERIADLEYERKNGFADLVNYIKKLDKDAISELYWNEENEMIAEAIKKAKAKIKFRFVPLTCERCNKISSTKVINHADYQHWLEIGKRWLCDDCEDYYKSLTDDLNYREYLKSEHWIKFATDIKNLQGKCEACGSQKLLQVHHKHYDTLFREKPDDVLVLCKNCHNKLH